MRILTERRITIARTNRLGRRIRQKGLTPADQEVLELVLLDAFDGLSAVSEVLRAELPGVSFTPRLKTVGTLVDKLNREATMALSRMRDVAGIRIVEEMTRDEQDVLVSQIKESVEGCSTIDRRARPSFGYRAVHIEVDCGGSFVEIQVRTGLQDQWAQIVERLADSWGRQVRYGGGPPKPSHEIIPGFTRAEFWTMVQEFAEQIDGVERDEAAIAVEVDHDAEDERLLVAVTNRRQMAELLAQMERIVSRGRI